jgi:ribonuclease E
VTVAVAAPVAEVVVAETPATAEVFPADPSLSEPAAAAATGLVTDPEEALAPEPEEEGEPKPRKRGWWNLAR